MSPPASVAQTDEPAPFIMEPFDSNTPNVARVYDFLLGGKDHFAADREFAERLAQAVPGVQQNVRYNRDFLGRAVRHLAGDLGIRQFLDIGTGLPTRNNVHEAVQRIAPQSRTVYIDRDPVVVSHGQALLNDGQTTAFIAEDVRRPGAILSCPEFTRLINLKKPVGIVLAGLLHFVPDHDDPYGAVIWLKEALAAGSALVISHAVTTEETLAGAQLYTNETSQQGVPRTTKQIEAFYDGLVMIEPGLVPVPMWRPDGAVPAGAEKVWWYGGIGVKP